MSGLQSADLLGPLSTNLLFTYVSTHQASNQPPCMSILLFWFRISESIMLFTCIAPPWWRNLPMQRNATGHTLLPHRLSRPVTASVPPDIVTDASDCSEISEADIVTWNLESSDFVQKSRCTYPDLALKQLLTSRPIRSLFVRSWLAKHCANDQSCDT
jgi:hypothetical protein